MPPFEFDFGKQTGRAFRQSFQAAQDRQQQAKRQRALQRLRKRRLEQKAQLARERMNRRDERAREGTIEVDRGNVGFLPGEGTVRMDAGTVARQRRRQQQSFWDAIQMLQQAKQPGTIEVQRQNVPQLPGEGPARVDPNTMIRHGAGGSGGAQGSSGGSGGSQGGGTASLPDSPEAAQEEIDRLVEQNQRAHDAGVSSDSLATTQKKILRLKQHRDSLRGGDPRAAPAQPDTNAATDTSRADTTAAADSTATRGPGRSPGHVPPQELGMTTGGVGGGGGADPTTADTRLRDMGGQPRSTAKFVEEAKDLVVEQGPKAVTRRLDSLLEKGRIDRATRDSVHARAVAELIRVRQRQGQQ